MDSNPIIRYSREPWLLWEALHDSCVVYSCLEQLGRKLDDFEVWTLSFPHDHWQCPGSRNNRGKLYPALTWVGDDRVAAVAVTDESQPVSTSYFQDVCDFGSKKN